MIMELKLLPKDLMNQRESTEILSDYISSFKEMVKYEGRQGKEQDLEQFSEAINMISIHMLISHFNALQGQSTTLTGMVGTIDQKCDVLAVANDAYDAAAVLCDGEYFDHPLLDIVARDVTDLNVDTQSTVTATYVPAHLHHILFEVFKNSMRATCETAEKRQIH